jgi:hypothetical protein
MGTRYRQGKAMSSFITYWPRYVFDPRRKRIERLGVVSRSEWTFGASADSEVATLSFRFSKSERDGIRVFEQSSNASAIVADAAEAAEFAARIVSEWSLEPYGHEAADVLAPGQPGEYMLAVRQELEKAARRRLADYWELLFSQ